MNPLITQGATQVVWVIVGLVIFGALYETFPRIAGGVLILLVIVLATKLAGQNQL